MSITVNDKNLGHATAYGYAVSKGFSGTEEEFAELMAGYADVGQRAETSAQIATSKASEASESASASEQSANSASASATTAQTKASEASASAQTATENANQASAYATTAITKASEASVSASESAQSASEASASASTASTKASEASASATTAETKASEASASANLANAKASEASGSANRASTKASEASQSATASETARMGAETAQTGAETAMDLAITAKNEAQQSATIATQKADSITGLTATATTLEPNESATANYNNGVLTIGIPKGVKGDKGDVGHSPVVTASKTDGTTSISVDGTVIATVDDGVDGQDGHTPVITASKVDGTTSVSVDDVVVATIDDGLKGDKGDEGEIPISAFSKDTASGDIVHITDGADSIPMDSVKVKIEPVQNLNGQEAPYPVGGSKNKFSGGTVVTVNNALFANVEVAPIPEGTYTISAVIGSEPTGYSGCRIAFRKADGSALESVNLPYTANTRSSVSFTLSDTCERIYFYYSAPTTGTGNQTYTNVQIEEGSTATDYAPYSNICPISGWTGTQVERTGVNIWNEEWESGSLSTSNGNPTVDSLKIRSKNFTAIKPNTQYYCVCDNPASYIWYYDENKEFLSFVTNNVNKVVTTPDHAYYAKFRIGDASNPQTDYSGRLSFNYPSTDHDYHPYTGNTYSITFPSEAGTIYSGELDITNGTLTVDRAMVDLGTLNWTLNTQTGANANVSSLGIKMVTSQNVKPNLIAEKYSVVGRNTHVWAIPEGSASSMVSQSNNGTYVYVGDGTFTPSGQLCYELATPIIYTLTPTEIATLYGENNIYSDCGDTSIEYRADATLYMERLISADKSGTTTTLYVKDKPIATISDGAKGDKGDAGDVNLAQLYSILPKDTASGSIAQIVDGADNVPMDSVKVKIEPMQDLHGQVAPYPAGSGVNLLPYASKDTDNMSGVTWTKNSDGSIAFSGTCSAATAMTFVEFKLPPGDYLFSNVGSTFNYTGGNSPTVYIRDLNNALTLAYVGFGKSVNGMSFSLSATTNIRFYAVFQNDNVVSGVLYPMIRLSTVTDYTYAPYENICPISGFTEANLVRTGKNLWDEEWESGSVSVTNGNITDANKIRSKNYIPVFSGETYYINSTSALITVIGFDKNKQGIRYLWDGRYDTIGRHNQPLVIPDGVYYLRFYTAQTTYNHDISINYPSTDHDYHPFTGNDTYSITLPTEAGTVYSGELDVTNGVLTVDRAMVDLESLGYSQYDSQNGRWNATISKMKSTSSRSANLWSDRWKATTKAATGDEGVMFGYLQNVYFYTSDSNNTPTGQLVYELATPITYHLTPTEIKSLMGDNNVWADAGDTTVEYRADINLYINKKITEVVNALS